ncbi:MAG: hypothetical protein AW08_02674 [Candidatus Accumulibacter adjunctus]|uniref:Uncharacterized protein n=1 Tax=Candidatus Accumulibacter adjunctus TaxID=1454001 RepID=A0A011M9B8_9PROT|nr:MAG: hypothetical protein AW08_02674 [Candidatus Accumulibacter adjunctus]
MEHFGPHQIDLRGVAGCRRSDDPPQDVVITQVRLIARPLAHRQDDLQIGSERLFESRQIPLFLDRVSRHVKAEAVVQHAFAHGGDGFRDVLGLEQFVALRVDHLALIVGNVVVLEQLLADVEVARLDLALRRFERPRDERMLDRLAFRHLQTLHDRLQAFAGENAQQRIIQGEVEARRAGVPLATGTTTQLVVDAPGFVTFGTDDVQAAGRHDLLVQYLPLRPDRGDLCFALGLAKRLVVTHRGHLLLDAAAKDDVGTAAGHVRGNGDHPRSAGLAYDLGLARMLLGVEHLVRQLFVVEQRRQQFRVLDRRRADQNRLAALAATADVGDDRAVLLLGGAKDLVVVVGPPHRLVGRDDDRLQAIDLLEFIGFRVGRPGHPGQLAVHAEIVLERDRSQCLVLVLDAYPFLRLDRLMQPVGPTAPGHQATGELIDDDHLAVLHDVLLIAQKEVVCPQCGVEVMDHQDVGSVIEAAAIGQQPGTGKQFFRMLVPILGHQDLMPFLVHPVVARAILFGAALEQWRDPVHPHI